jgi:hypothetical protein
MSDTQPTVEQPDGRDLAYWQALVQGVTEASRQTDKLVTTLAAGALGLSIAFIRDVAPCPHSQWLLAAAWSSLCLALALTLTSLVTSRAAHEAILKQLPRCDSVQDVDANPRSAKVTRWLTWLSIPALLAGVAFLVSFALLNLD